MHLLHTFNEARRESTNHVSDGDNSDGEVARLDVRSGWIPGGIEAMGGDASVERCALSGADWKVESSSAHKERETSRRGKETSLHGEGRCGRAFVDEVASARFCILHCVWMEKSLREMIARR